VRRGARLLHSAWIAGGAHGKIETEDHILGLRGVCSSQHGVPLFIYDVTPEIDGGENTRQPDYRLHAAGQRLNA